MIDPLTIDPLLLPYVSIEQRSQLPSTPCIYLLINYSGVVEYIWRSVNPPSNRMSTGQRSRLLGISTGRIAYLLIDDIDSLLEIEKALIQRFKPRFNSFTKQNILDSNYVLKVAKLREQKKLTQSQLADLIGVEIAKVNHWEKHQSALLRFVYIARLCYVLECNQPQLLINNCQLQIAKLRQSKNLSMRKLAEIVGVNVNTVKNWESKPESIEMFAKILQLCEVLECSVEDLFEVQNVGKYD